MSDLDRIDVIASTSEAINVAYEVAAHFANATISVHTDSVLTIGTDKIVSRGVATVRGKLNLSHQNIETNVVADCSLCVLCDWRRTAPALRCGARWIRRPEDSLLRADWHINSDESLCYVLDAEWRDCLADIEAKHGPDFTINAAALYCVNSARWLLYRHLQAYRRKLKKWPKEWPQWPHYEAGVIEYIRQKRFNKHLPR
jgi:hypothetical protein